MRHMTRTSAASGLAVSVLLLLSACVTTLAPTYDQTIVNGLQSTNQQLMQFFASASSGTMQATAV